MTVSPAGERMRLFWKRAFGMRMTLTAQMP